MKVLNKVFYSLHQVMVVAAKIMILAMTIITTVQVFCRYVLDFSIRWSEEVPLILMVWFGFISMAIGVKKRLHISIELFYNLFPKKLQFVVRKFVDVTVAVFGICMIYYGYKLASFTMTSTLPATKLPTGWLYMIIPIAGIMITYDTLMDLFGLDKLENNVDVIGGEN